MAASRALLLLCLVVLPSCMLGYGKAYPGAALRLREGATYKSVGGGWYQFDGLWSEEGGKSKIGALFGVRGGAGTLAIGNHESTGFDAEFAGEVSYSVVPSLSLGVALAHEYSYGSLQDTPTGEPGADVQWGRWVSMVMVQFVPVRPFVLRGGIGRQFAGSAEAGDMELDVGGGNVMSLGIGMAVPFAGLHFVPTIDYRRSSGGAADFGEGTSGALHSNAWIASVWVVF